MGGAERGRVRCVDVGSGEDEGPSVRIQARNHEATAGPHRTGGDADNIWKHSEGAAMDRPITNRLGLWNSAIAFDEATSVPKSCGSQAGLR
jgi:hypothetical protein